MSYYYNFCECIVVDVWWDIKEKGVVKIWNEWVMWNWMWMSDIDILDVIGYIYIFLMNGLILE